MKITLGTSYFARNTGDFPEFPVVNMYAEEAPSEETISLLSRPGLSSIVRNLGSGPIRQIFQQDGVLGSATFYVSGSEIYRETTLIGTITGDGPVSIAGYSDFLFICAGAGLWGYNGSVLSLISTPDDVEILKLGVVASRLVAIGKNTQKFFWTEPLKTSIGALAFSSAEVQTDNLLDLQIVGDMLVLFGSETVEFWPVSGSSDQPFVPLRGRTFTRGIKNTGASVAGAGAFVWVTDSNKICYETVENIISFPGLEKQLRDAQNAYLWKFEINGDTCLAVSLPTGSWVFHERSQLWSQFSTVTLNNVWIAHCSCGDKFGSGIDGTIFQFNNNYSDDGFQLERKFRAWMPLTGETLTVNDVTLRTNPGKTDFSVGLYSNPKIEMRFSKDGGNLWSAWRERSMGTIGKYRTWTKWNSNGLFSYPGVLLEFRITDPVPFRVSSVHINEPRGGY